MIAQVAGRHARRGRAFGRLANDARLVLAEGDQHDLAGFEDRAQAHRDGLHGHVLLAEEIAGRVAPRERIERGQPRAAVGGAERLVETDVPVAADAQQLHVDAAGPGDGGLVLAAMLVEPIGRDQTVGDEDVLGADVDVVEKVLVHPAVIALQPLGPQAQVFVEVERDDVDQVEPLVLVQSHQLAIDAHRRAAGRQPQHGLLPMRPSLADDRAIIWATCRASC